MSFKRLHEEFIEPSNRAMNFDKLPVQPKEGQPPILPAERWRNVNDALHKTYKFRRLVDRNQFVVSLLAYEQVVGHNAELVIAEQQINLKLQTKDINRITELDKEYARYADVLFKDIVYNNEHE